MDNEKDTIVKVRRLPYVGETVFSKILKLERVVKDIGNNTITLEAKKTNILTSFFELLSIDFDRKMSLSDFEIDYLLPEDVQNPTPNFTAEELKGTFAKLGELYQHIETHEVVIMGVVVHITSKVPLIELHSEDKMFDGEYISYLVDMSYFKSHFVNIENKRRKYRDLGKSSCNERTFSLSF